MPRKEKYISQRKEDDGKASERWRSLTCAAFRYTLGSLVIVGCFISYIFYCIFRSFLVDLITFLLDFCKFSC